MNLSNFIKKIIPKKILNYLLPIYHKILAYAAAFWYGKPSEKMIVIGVTGTKGKSTTAELIAKVLEQGRSPLPPAGGHPYKGEDIKVGLASTVKFKIADKEWLNDKKMTMLGRFALQKLLSQMVKEGCKYAVIETSSEGIKQSRHKGINYDYAVFTNLTPEHIESHGSFENYKKAKLELFKHLEKSKRKKLASFQNPPAPLYKRGNAQDKSDNIKKVIIVNEDDKYAKEFLNFDVDKKIAYSVKNNRRNEALPRLSDGNRAEDVRLDKAGTSFVVNNVEFKLNLIGLFNVYNALPAIIIGKNEAVEMEKIKKALEKVKGIPGRMEFIDEGQDFFVIVDYAHEEASMKKLYETIKIIKKGGEFDRIIHIFGSCGGGRDKSRRPVLGEIAAKNADFVIVANEDTFDDDPMEIIEEVSEGAEKAGKIRDKDLFVILDRREAIRKAVRMAKKNDLVLITGKGSEQMMCLAGGRKIKWDDRAVAREEIKKLQIF